MTKRECGDCQLCCKILPVKEIGKLAGVKCDHQKHRKGCMIYANRPRSCVFWSCQWLMSEDAKDLSRPDRSHYVIDPLPDFVRMVYDDGKPMIELPVIQIWADENYPDAHRDPNLRAYIQARALESGMAAIIRVAGNGDAIGLFPPAISEDGEWHEIQTNFKPEMQHSSAEINRVMEARGLKIEIVTSED
jgi:hypothetical protein